MRLPPQTLLPKLASSLAPSLMQACRSGRHAARSHSARRRRRGDPRLRHPLRSATHARSKSSLITNLVTAFCPPVTAINFLPSIVCHHSSDVGAADHLGRFARPTPGPKPGTASGGPCSDTSLNLSGIAPPPQPLHRSHPPTRSPRWPRTLKKAVARIAGSSAFVDTRANHSRPRSAGDGDGGIAAGGGAVGGSRRRRRR